MLFEMNGSILYDFKEFSHLPRVTVYVTLRSTLELEK